MQNIRNRAVVVTVIIGLICAVALLLFGAREHELPPALVEVSAPEPVLIQWPERVVIGNSVEGRPIEAYTFGTGTIHMLFVGGVHGGYEWNSVVLAYRAIDYFTENQHVIPDTLRVTIIPSLNPDGVFDVVGKEGRFTEVDVIEKETNGVGRLNANGVDLNRNFDCKWQPKAVWRGTSVGAGTSAFSEPEARALKTYVGQHEPSAVVFWHSKSNAVYASECEAGILSETRILMDTYAQASGYPPVDVFDAYVVTGDAEGWLASIGIPAVTVELSTHLTIEWEKNLAGTLATITHYGATTENN
jgi:hypothetical protein